MDENAVIAVVFICIIIALLGFYYLLKRACTTLVRETCKVTQKAKKTDVELAPET